MPLAVKILPQNWVEYVQAQPVLRIATLGDDRVPHVTPVWFAFDGSTFYIATDPNAKKLRNIKKNKNVSLVIDSYDTNNWDLVKGIIFTGTAELIEIPEETKKAKTLLRQKYPHYANKYSDWLEGKEGKKPAIIIKVVPSRYSFWID